MCGSRARAANYGVPSKRQQCCGEGVPHMVQGLPSPVRSVRPRILRMAIVGTRHEKAVLYVKTRLLIFDRSEACMFRFSFR